MTSRIQPHRATSRRSPSPLWPLAMAGLLGLAAAGCPAEQAPPKTPSEPDLTAEGAAECAEGEDEGGDCVPQDCLAAAALLDGGAASGFELEDGPEPDCSELLRE